MKQKTINKDIVVQGIGVHSGQTCKVILRPAPVDTGIIFFNPKFPEENIKLGKVVPEEAMHASVLKYNGLIISTIEHLMAAVSMFQLDNLLIEVCGVEIPILDGSALTFIELIQQAGTEEQAAEKHFLTPNKKLEFIDSGSDRFLELHPAKFDVNSQEYDRNLYFNYTSEFQHPLIGKSVLNGVLSLSFFEKEVAPARTFGFLEQLPYLRSKGLAKGTSLGNTVVIGEEEFLNKPRFENEFIRHKLLDLIGDLALLGKNLSGTIVAKKTGHNFNRRIIKNYIQKPAGWKLI